MTYHESKTGGDICEGDENSSWPNYEDEHIEWYLTGCYLDKDVTPWRREQVEVDFEPAVGQEVWAVYVNYNTGGSFGCTKGACSILSVHDTKEKAEAVKKLVYEDDTYTPACGYRVWVGYFESFNFCEIESLIVK